MLSHDDDIQTHTQFILFNIVMFFLEVHASEDWQLEIHLVADPPPPIFKKIFANVTLIFLYVFFWGGRAAYPSQASAGAGISVREPTLRLASSTTPRWPTWPRVAEASNAVVQRMAFKPPWRPLRTSLSEGPHRKSDS